MNVFKICRGSLGSVTLIFGPFPCPVKLNCLLSRDESKGTSVSSNIS